MPEGFYKPLVKLLSAHGFYHAGNFKGSHERWVRDGEKLTLCVPRTLNSRHTANAILKDAGIGKKL
jgi:predicted RNA binding protein YcfA (HicA-like mRNA interferase family)